MNRCGVRAERVGTNGSTAFGGSGRTVVVAEILAYVAAGLVGLWGVSHAIPTRSVIAGLGDLSTDNRRVLVLTALTGARTAVIWFKICPVLLTTSSALLLVASAV